MAMQLPSGTISLGDMRSASHSTGAYSFTSTPGRFSGKPLSGGYNLNSLKSAVYPMTYPYSYAAYGTMSSGCQWNNVYCGPSASNRWIVAMFTAGVATKTSLATVKCNGATPINKGGQIYSGGWVSSAIHAWKQGTTGGDTMTSIGMQNSYLSNAGCYLRVFVIYSDADPYNFSTNPKRTVLSDSDRTDGGSVSPWMQGGSTYSVPVGAHCFGLSFNTEDSGTKSFGPSNCFQGTWKQDANTTVAYGVSTASGARTFTATSTDSVVRHPGCCWMTIAADNASAPS